MSVSHSSGCIIPTVFSGSPFICFHLFLLLPVVASKLLQRKSIGALVALFSIRYLFVDASSENQGSFMDTCFPKNPEIYRSLLILFLGKHIDHPLRKNFRWSALNSDFFFFLLNQGIRYICFTFKFLVVVVWHKICLLSSKWLLFSL